MRNLVQEPSRDHVLWASSISVRPESNSCKGSKINLQYPSIIFQTYRCSMMYICNMYLGCTVFGSEASLEDILTRHFMVDLNYITRWNKLP